MTSNTATTEKWYDKTWLVILLCVIFFPVGLYALWKSNRISKGWKIGGTVIIGLLVVAALNDKDNSPAKATNSSVNEEKTNAPTEEAKQPAEQEAVTPQTETTAKSDYKIGDEVKFSNYIMQVTNVEVGKTYNSVWKPKEGKKLVAVEVLITNNSQEKVDYNPLSDFDLTDENGYEFSLAAFGGKDPAMGAGEIPPGRKVRGWISFEVEKASKKFELIYSPGFFNSQKLYINLEK